MGQRFEQLFKLQSNLYTEQSPIVVSDGYLLKDNESGKVIAQLKFQSISEKQIKALKIELLTYDVTEQQIENVTKYQYLDLNIGIGQFFGSNKAIVLSNNTARSFKINTITIVFHDGTTQNITGLLEPLPDLTSIENILTNKDILEQYRLMVSKIALYIPQKEKDLWLCSCGKWNAANNCYYCKADKETTFNLLDNGILNHHVKERLIKKEEEKIEKKIANEKKKEDFIKNVFPILPLIFGIVSLTSLFNIIPLVLGLILAVVGMCFSIIAKKKHLRRTYMKVGFVLCIIEIVFLILYVSVVILPDKISSTPHQKSTKIESTKNESSFKNQTSQSSISQTNKYSVFGFDKTLCIGMTKKELFEYINKNHFEYEENDDGVSIYDVLWDNKYTGLLSCAFNVSDEVNYISYLPYDTLNDDEITSISEILTSQYGTPYQSNDALPDSMVSSSIWSCDNYVVCYTTYTDNTVFITWDLD